MSCGVSTGKRRLRCNHFRGNLGTVTRAHSNHAHTYHGWSSPATAHMCMASSASPHIRIGRQPISFVLRFRDEASRAVCRSSRTTPFTRTTLSHMPVVSTGPPSAGGRAAVSSDADSGARRPAHCPAQQRFFGGSRSGGAARSTDAACSTLALARWQHGSVQHAGQHPLDCAAPAATTPPDAVVAKRCSRSECKARRERAARFVARNEPSGSPGITSGANT